jgi:hypothetical protein
MIGVCIGADTRISLAHVYRIYEGVIGVGSVRPAASIFAPVSTVVRELLRRTWSVSKPVNITWMSGRWMCESCLKVEISDDCLADSNNVVVSDIDLSELSLVDVCNYMYIIDIEVK